MLFVTNWNCGYRRFLKTDVKDSFTLSLLHCIEDSEAVGGSYISVWDVYAVVHVSNFNTAPRMRDNGT